jgi:hypothetical protein
MVTSCSLDAQIETFRVIDGVRQTTRSRFRAMTRLKARVAGVASQLQRALRKSWSLRSGGAARILIFARYIRFNTRCSFGASMLGTARHGLQAPLNYE